MNLYCLEMKEGGVVVGKRPEESLEKFQGFLSLEDILWIGEYYVKAIKGVGYQNLDEVSNFYHVSNESSRYAQYVKSWKNFNMDSLYNSDDVVASLLEASNKLGW